MAHLIDKSALVAEIERRRNICKKVVWDLRTEENKDYYQGKEEAYNEVLAILDSMQEEPVSEELENAAFGYADACKYYGTEKLLCVEHFKAGANWQKKQFEKNRLKHCNSITNEQAELEQGFIDQHLDKHQRMPTYLDAIEYGMNLQKEQMMAKAVDSRVYIDAGGYPYIPQMELYDYDNDVPLAKEGDKYKVILIKEK